MGQSVNMTFEMDYDVKKSMEDICKEKGISMATVFNLFAKKVSSEKKIPFEIIEDPYYSDSNIKYLKKLMNDVKTGKAHFAEHELIEV